LSVSAPGSVAERRLECPGLSRSRFIGSSARLLGRVWIHGEGKVHVGDGATIDGRAAPVELHALLGGEIRVEAGAFVGPGTSIESLERVHLAEGARIGAFCKLMDSDFHPVTGDRFGAVDSVPILVGAGADVGPRSVLLPGSRIAPGQVIPSGAVFSRRPGSEPSRRTPAPVRIGPQFLLARLAFAAFHVSIGRVVFRRCQVGPWVRARGVVQIRNEGTIRIGRGSNFRRGDIPTELIAHPGGTLEIGERCDVNYGAVFEARRSIRVGQRCMFGSHVHVSDFDGRVSTPVVIGDRVWLAHGAVVHPGVAIGEGSVVAAGSVVTRNVPPGHLAIGNPARSMPLRMVAPGPAMPATSMVQP